MALAACGAPSGGTARESKNDPEKRNVRLGGNALVNPNDATQDRWSRRLLRSCDECLRKVGVWESEDRRSSVDVRSYVGDDENDTAARDEQQSADGMRSSSDGWPS